MKHRAFPLTLAILAVGVLASFCWAYAATFTDLATAWSSDPQYSHGYLVPAFALFLLWLRRRQAPTPLVNPAWWAVPILALLLGGWVLAARLSYITPDQLSIPLVVACVVLILGGWPLLRWSWPAVAFLCFMIPLHPRLKDILTHPLQRLATETSAFLLQMMGFNAQSEGTILYLTETDLGVVEACSGLRMLLLFFALTTAILILRKPRWYETVVLLLSAAPIAVLANIIRITVTAVLHETVGPRLADLVFHDLAGWFMVLLGVALLWIEIGLLPYFIQPVTPNAPAVTVLVGLTPVRATGTPAAPRGLGGRLTKV
jgi:exosortase